MYKYGKGDGDGTSILDNHIIQEAMEGYVVNYWKYGCGYYFTRNTEEGWGNGTGYFAYCDGNGEGFGGNEYPYTLLTGKEVV